MTKFKEAIKNKWEQYKALPLWKRILLFVALVGFVLLLLWLLVSRQNDEEKDYVGIDYDLDIDINEHLDNQTIVKNLPARFIGGIDVTGSKLKENEKQFLREFSEQSNRFIGKEQTKSTSHTGWCSDGKYTRQTETKYIFGEDMSIAIKTSYRDDDGQSGSSCSTLTNGRDIINFVKENRKSEMFNDVRDIVDIL